MFVRYSFYLALRLQCVVAIPLSSLGARDEQVLEVQLSASISKGPSQQIDHTFPAFAFEGATFFEYAGMVRMRGPLTSNSNGLGVFSDLPLSRP